MNVNHQQLISNNKFKNLVYDMVIELFLICIVGSINNY